MPARVLEFDWPDRVVIGTVGLPGARTFYLQVRAGTRIVSIALEKLQSALLAEKVDEVLDQLITVEGNRFSVPTSTPVELVDNDQLESVQEEFRAGAIGIGWDPTTAQILLEVLPIAGDDDASLEEGTAAESEKLLVRMPVGTARAFTLRTREVVDAGRPLCTLCGHPMDPDGHICVLPET
ncbi:DUF3090 family protein [Citricoccus nitrophenolicus]|uniref:DUF3090 family protein n=1 Tax=Citricoccus nitrophenolicus TaxID=863575 RepID=UPI0031E52E73